MITDAQIADACNEAYLKAGSNAYFGNGFRAGVAFAVKQLSNGPIPPIVQPLCNYF